MFLTRDKNSRFVFGGHVVYETSGNWERESVNSCPVSWPSLSKMAGRGRGRGRGRGLSFDVGMIGFGRGEALPAAILQPPPLYPVGGFLYDCVA